MRITAKYSIDRPPGIFEKCVFIGGNYSFGSRIEDIAEAVVDCEYQPIIAWEFGIPLGTERHCSKRIIEQCKYAIFEVSSDAGHFFEMDDAEEYSLECLCLWDGHQGPIPRISAMVRSHQVFMKNNKSYLNTRQLQYQVFNFLKNRPAQS